MAEKMSECMKYLTPRYLIGLSATPYRTDGLDAIIDLYFGTEKIYRKLERYHEVYKIKTNFVPIEEDNKNGKLDWNTLLNSLCYNEERSEMIVRLVKYLPDRNILILSKRVEQAKYIVKRLQEEKEDVTSLIGKNKEFSTESRILVGIIQKVGVGFDHPKLNTLIMASDALDYFQQYLGRILRDPNSPVTPWIFDIVDKHGLLEKHFLERKKVYTEAKGVIRNFSECFPDFEF
jgi:superfamily II DNA or RNA helicase